MSTDQNTAATMQNSAVMAALTGILAASMGSGCSILAEWRYRRRGRLGHFDPIDLGAREDERNYCGGRLLPRAVEFQRHWVQPGGNAVQRRRA